MDITTPTDLHITPPSIKERPSQEPREGENGARAGTRPGGTTRAPTIDDFVPYTPPPKHFSAFISQCFKAYGASLIGTFVAVPIITSAITVAIYLTHTPSSFAIVLGVIYTFILWWIAALPFSYFTRASGANTVSYGLLLSRLRLLEAHLASRCEYQEKKRRTTTSLFIMKRLPSKRLAAFIKRSVAR